MNIANRLRNLGESRRAGLAALLLAVASTAIWVQLPGGSSAAGGALAGQVADPKTGVKLQATVSNPLVVEGSDGLVYLDLTVATPSRGVEPGRVPTDMIVVLDRSGSMGEGDKWRFATHAIQSLLDRLEPADRVALISFDDEARIDAPLTWARPEGLERLRGIVRELAPGASTNLGDGLLDAERLVRGEGSAGRRRRVLLLSDGQANRGVVEPRLLGAMAGRISERGAVLSTIGMGLGFNETLLASLADLGMGNFDYLESLESLGRILVAELDDSRSLYAEGSEIRIDLPPGVEVADVSGYPFTMEGRTAVIRTGQLPSGVQKRFMATLRIADSSPSKYPLGTMELSYRVDGTRHLQSIPSGQFEIACVPAERKIEALKSIDADSYREAWIKNNLGSLMREVGDFVRGGRQEEARAALKAYRENLEEADEAVPGLKGEAASELQELEARLDDAFTGRDQAIKQNRAAKSLLKAGQRRQRNQEKNAQ